ncbi:MAG: hypothetical protein HUJ29_11215 [Gammaproteobacteria bacterium]|nr:hypothetical protein [Gammaproteobacteria bacterium]
MGKGNRDNANKGVIKCGLAWLLFGALIAPLPLFASQAVDMAIDVDGTTEPYLPADPMPMPVDIGLGISLGGTDLLDVVAGKRLAQKGIWGLGAKYHYAGGLHNFYATATPHNWPMELRAGLSYISHYDTAMNPINEVGLAVGIGLLHKHRIFRDKLRLHLFDLHYVYTPSRNYTVVSISIVYVFRFLTQIK